MQSTSSRLRADADGDSSDAGDAMSDVFDVEWTPSEADCGSLNLYQLLNKAAAVDMFRPWKRALARAFSAYSRVQDGTSQATFAELKNAHNSMNMAEFLLFLKDFAILPAHVSREEATRLFWRATTAVGAITHGRNVPTVIKSKTKGEMSYDDVRWPADSAKRLRSAAHGAPPCAAPRLPARRGHAQHLSRPRPRERPGYRDGQDHARRNRARQQADAGPRHAGVPAGAGASLEGVWGPPRVQFPPAL